MRLRIEVKVLKIQSIIDSICISGNDIDVFNNIKEEDYPDITEINLSHNEITIIPEQIGSLEKRSFSKVA